MKMIDHNESSVIPSSTIVRVVRLLHGRCDCRRNTAKRLKPLSGGKDHEPQLSNPPPPDTSDTPPSPRHVFRLRRQTRRGEIFLTGYPGCAARPGLMAENPFRDNGGPGTVDQTNRESLDLSIQSFIRETIQGPDSCKWNKLSRFVNVEVFFFSPARFMAGLNGFWDYGPLGVELKRNVKEAWWQDMVTRHDDINTLEGAPSPFAMEGLDCTIIMHPQVWKCSGHYDLFHDFMVDCKESKSDIATTKLSGDGWKPKVKRAFITTEAGDDQQDQTAGQGTQVFQPAGQKYRRSRNGRVGPCRLPNWRTLPRQLDRTRKQAGNTDRTA